MVNFYAGDKEAANQEIDDEDDIDEEEREESDAMKELKEIYNKLKTSSQENIASSQAGIVEHLSNIAQARNKANEGQEKNAKAMLKQSNKKQIMVKVNDLVLLYVDPVDRAKSSPNNLLCYVIEQKYDKFKLACSAGILDRVYSFNSFRKTNLETNFTLDSIPKRDPNLKATKANPDKNNYYNFNGIDYIEIGIREAMKCVSVGLGQGFVKCNCNGKCATNRCGCFLGKIGCNTKCHPKSTKCENKTDRIEPNEELSESSDSEE